MPYSFNTTLLSAEKTGNPQLLNTSLSSNGVNIIRLGADYKGITFNYLPSSELSGVLTTLNLDGCFVRIDRAYHSQQFALVKLPSSNIETFAVFTQLSTAAVPATSAIDTDVIDQDGRRKWLYGYK